MAVLSNPGTDNHKRMNQIVHIANTNVEFEFAHPNIEPLETSLSRYPIFLQLQFLPLLYAGTDDIIAVSALPDADYLAALEQTGWWPQGLPQLALLCDQDSFEGKKCLSWGPSRQVQKWAEARRMLYSSPDWKIASLINSKAFSFRYTSLDAAALLWSKEALLDWMKKVPGAKVLKTCFGLSGGGNRRIENSLLSQKLLGFCRKEWKQNRPILGEPWLDRLGDFSTQWFIHSNQCIEWVGGTRFEVDAHGVYQGTLVGSENQLFPFLEPFLQEHRQFALKALTEMAAMGFFGPIGIDALLYRDPKTDSVSLFPLVEINGRETMSLVALRLQQRIAPHQMLRLAFQQTEASGASLLPHRIINEKGDVIHFRKRLTASILQSFHQ